MGVAAPGTDLAGIRPRVQAEQRARQGGGQVHRAAIDADGGGRPADQPEQMGEVGLVGQVQYIVCPMRRRRGARPDHDHPARRQAGGESDRQVVGQALARAARIRVDDDGAGQIVRGNARHRFPGRQGKARVGGIAAQGRGQSQIAIDRVEDSADPGPLAVKPARPFPRIRQAGERPRPQPPRDEHAAQQALEIGRDVEPARRDRPRAPAPPHETRRGAQPAQLAAGKDDDRSQVGVAVEQGGPLVVDDPVEAQRREGALQGMDGRQRVHHVAERTGFHHHQVVASRQIDGAAGGHRAARGVNALPRAGRPGSPAGRLSRSSAGPASGRTSADGRARNGCVCRRWRRRRASPRRVAARRCRH